MSRPPLPLTTRPNSGWRYPILCTVVAGLIFGIFYTAANLYAASLPTHDIGNIALPWEHGVIPFWPWTVVPYCSLDVLFFISIWVCRERAEMRAHTLRLCTAIIIASICFVIWPLGFGWGRPEVSGVFGWLFDALRFADQPFNQAPSLHIALLCVIWPRLIRHSPKHWHFAIHLWCLLTALSVLTTWQHHLLDVPTGAALGILVCLCITIRPPQKRAITTGNRK